MEYEDYEYDTPALISAGTRALARRSPILKLRPSQSQARRKDSKVKEVPQDDFGLGNIGIAGRGWSRPPEIVSQLFGFQILISMTPAKPSMNYTTLYSSVSAEVVLR